MTYRNEEAEANRPTNPSETAAPDESSDDVSLGKKSKSTPRQLLTSISLRDGAREFTLRYEIDDFGVTIVGCEGEPSRLVVPAEIRDRPVVAIGSDAFSGCASLTSVSLPDGLRTLDFGAFDDCSPELTLYVAADFVAEKYAGENGIRFEVRDESAASERLQLEAR